MYGSRWQTVLLALLVAVLAGCEVETAGTESDAAVPEGLQPAEVVRVVDGDTIVVDVNGREERVRYIGIDTPETVRPGTPVECFGKEASAANEELVEGEMVYLEKDVSETDRFGRLLRYVYVDDPASDELLFVNLELVEQGYAQVSTFPPDVRYENALLAAQQAAREEQRGLWGEC